MGKITMDTDLLMEAFQYVLGVIPGDVAGNVVAVVTAIVTFCTLIIRFWKEPSQSSKLYKLWHFLNLLASFKTSKNIKKK